jgi:formylglycine-generating enzyme required for sulfatase activity
MKRYALLLAANRYDDRLIQDLRYAEQDAKELKDFLRKRARFDRVEDFCGKDLTKDVALNAAERLAKELEDAGGGLLLLFYAGHGFTHQNKHCLLTPSARLRHLDEFHHAVTVDKLKSMTALPRVERQLVVDACRSHLEAGARALFKGYSPAGLRNVVGAAPGPQAGGWSVLASCDEGEQASEVETLGHGVFTLAWLEELRTAEKDGREVRLDEQLVERLRYRVAELGRRNGLDGSQRPWMQSNTTPPVILGGTPGGIRPAVSPALPTAEPAPAPAAGGSVVGEKAHPLLATAAKKPAGARGKIFELAKLPFRTFLMILLFGLGGLAVILFMRHYVRPIRFKAEATGAGGVRITYISEVPWRVWRANLDGVSGEEAQLLCEKPLGTNTINYEDTSVFPGRWRYWVTTSDEVIPNDISTGYEVYVLPKLPWSTAKRERSGDLKVEWSVPKESIPPDSKVAITATDGFGEVLWRSTEDVQAQRFSFPSGQPSLDGKVQVALALISERWGTSGIPAQTVAPRNGLTVESEPSGGLKIRLPQYADAFEIWRAPAGRLEPAQRVRVSSGFVTEKEFVDSMVPPGRWWYWALRPESKGVPPEDTYQEGVVLAGVQQLDAHRNDDGSVRLAWLSPTTFQTNFQTTIWVREPGKPLALVTDKLTNIGLTKIPLETGQVEFLYKGGTTNGVKGLEFVVWCVSQRWRSPSVTSSVPAVLPPRVKQLAREKNREFDLKTAGIEGATELRFYRVQSPRFETHLDDDQLDRLARPIGENLPIGINRAAIPHELAKSPSLDAITNELAKSPNFLDLDIEQSSTPPLTQVAVMARNAGGVTRVSEWIFCENPKTNLLNWTNTLGMRFIPIPRSKVLLSIWETRNKDYEGYVRERSGGDMSWTNSIPIPPNSLTDDLATSESPKKKKPSKLERDQIAIPLWAKEPERKPLMKDSTYPVVNVSWADAQKFCKWLTDREHKLGWLPSNRRYRLPTDKEWSVAAGIDIEPDSTPIERYKKIPDVYPWGTWPPPPNTGNFDNKMYLSSYKRTVDGSSFREVSEFRRHVDPFETTAPVGSFSPDSPNGFKCLFDISGNVSEWCEDQYIGPSLNWVDFVLKRVVRGGSWVSNLPDSLLSSARFAFNSEGRTNHIGFRVVIARVGDTD